MNQSFDQPDAEAKPVDSSPVDELAARRKRVHTDVSITEILAKASAPSDVLNSYARSVSDKRYVEYVNQLHSMAGFPLMPLPSTEAQHA